MLFTAGGAVSETVCEDDPICPHTSHALLQGPQQDASHVGALTYANAYVPRGLASGGMWWALSSVLPLLMAGP